MNTDIDLNVNHSTGNNNNDTTTAASLPPDHNVSGNDGHVNNTTVSLRTSATSSFNDVESGVTRIKLTPDELVTLTSEEIKMKWLKQDLYITHLETQIRELESRQDKMIPLIVHEDKLKSQSNEFRRRENVLVMKLAAKEHDHSNHFVSDPIDSHYIYSLYEQKQLGELKKSVIPSDDHLKRCFIDPAVNFMFEKMRKEVESAKSRVEEMENEMSAWKFTPESNTGKRLMAKCRQLYQENEELGKLISSGRVGHLESNLAIQTNLTEEYKKSQSELDEFLAELDEELEGMQSTIIHHQTQLKECKFLLQHSQSSNDHSSNPPSISPSNDSSHQSLPQKSLESNISITITDHDQDVNSKDDNILKRSVSIDLMDVSNGDMGHCPGNGSVKKLKIENSTVSEKMKVDNPFSPTIVQKEFSDDQKSIGNGEQMEISQV